MSKKTQLSTVSRSTFIGRLFAGCMAVNLFIIAMVGLSLLLSLRQYEERAAITSHNLARLIEQFVDGSLEKIDVTLLSAKDEIERQIAKGGIDGGKINAFLIRQGDRLPEIDGLRMLNERGDIVYGKGVNPSALKSAADRDYYIYLRDNPDAGLFISRPIVSRIINKWAVIIARRLNRPDGTFAGVVYGVIPLDYFTRLFSSIDIGRHGVIALRDRELGVIIRFPEMGKPGSMVGQKLVSPKIMEMIRQGKATGTYKVITPIDHLERTYTYRRVSGFPLYVVVGLGAMDYLGEWHDEVYKMSVLAVLFLLATFFASWLIFHDWERRKSAVQQIRESEIRYRRLFQGAVLGVFQTTPEGRFVAVNPAFARMFGFLSPDELMTQLASSAEIYAEPARRPEIIRTIMESGGTIEIEVPFRRRDETIFTGKLHVWQVEDSEEGIVYLEGFIEDITERLNAEGERRRLEAQLNHAQKMEAVGQLAGGIAHDFNNLLTAILGNISLLKVLMPRDDKRACERLAAAETASNRAKELTQRLLTFSKGGAPVRKSVSLAEIVTESAGLALTGSSSICEFSLAPDLWPVYVDDGQISQVIGNIVINAHQAMPEGGRIRINGENILYEKKDFLSGLQGRFVRLDIRDEGHGIDEELRGRVFDPFFSTKSKGRGLGLASCYSIIKNHEGHISLHSEPREGTTFTIILPASASPAVNSGCAAEQPVFGSGRILIMDDEEIIREIAREIIEQLGYRAEVASDGEEAIRIYGRAMESGSTFHAVIMDLTVPGGMGGKEAVSRLLAIDPDVRAIVSSGYSNDPIMANYREYGFVEVVSKPYTIEELSRKLMEVLNRDLT
jgi:PAS domain S-box-containing protein